MIRNLQYSIPIENMIKFEWINQLLVLRKLSTVLYNIMSKTTIYLAAVAIAFVASQMMI